MVKMDMIFNFNVTLFREPINEKRGVTPFFRLTIFAKNVSSLYEIIILIYHIIIILIDIIHFYL